MQSTLITRWGRVLQFGEQQHEKKHRREKHQDETPEERAERKRAKKERKEAKKVIPCWRLLRCSTALNGHERAVR